MNADTDVTVIDFIARTDDPGVWKIVLVEEGPWRDVTAELQRVQNRLYDCIDGALDGQLAAKFPEADGKTIILQLDGYNLPEDAVQTFWNAFSSGVMQEPDYAQALQISSHVKAFAFELNLRMVESGA